MTGWTGEELEKIGSSDELQIASIGPDGALRKPTTVWVGGVTRDVTFVDAKGDLDDRIDDAYRTKYRRYSPGIAGSVVTPQARSATIRLIPRPTTS